MTRAPTPADLAMSEKSLLAGVKKLAETYGFHLYHTYDSRRSTPGFPDCILAHPERNYVLAIELKKHDGRLTKPQLEWLALLHGRTVRAAVVRPGDLEELRRELAGEGQP